MSERTPGRPEVDDELVRAYARARALARGPAGDGDGPSAAVRANVLAAAQAVAAEAAARRAQETGTPAPLAPVAPPVAEVGGGRPRAVNLASWRVRAGAGLCAAALVAVVGWRFDALRRDDAVQVASVAKSVEAQIVADVPPPPPKEVALPAPAVTEGAAPSEAMRAELDKDLVVAQADQPYRSQGERRSPPVARADRRDAAPAAAARRTDEAPVVVAAAAPPAPAPVAAAQAPVALNSAAARATLGEAPAPAPAPTAAPSTREERLAALSTRVVEAKARSGAPAADASRQAGPAVTGASMRAAPAPLQAAADRGDVEALKTLLAEPGAHVDAPDADGRTALLHAVLAQQPGAVRLLLAAGGDPGRADHAGLTPREAARTGASAEIAALLAAPR